MAVDKRQDIEKIADVVITVRVYQNHKFNSTQFVIDPTPRTLYELLPIKESKVMLNEPYFVKDIQFKFNRKNFTLSFYRKKEAGEP